MAEETRKPTLSGVKLDGRVARHKDSTPRYAPFAARYNRYEDELTPADTTPMTLPDLLRLHSPEKTAIVLPESNTAIS